MKASLCKHISIVDMAAKVVQCAVATVHNTACPMGSNTTVPEHKARDNIPLLHIIISSIA